MSGGATGDTDGYEAFFDRHFPVAFGVARRITGNVAVAEELASEALTRALIRWPSIKDDDRRTGWIVRVTTNLAIDVMRRRPPPLPPARSSPDAGDTVVLRAALVAALGRLSDRQRRVVVLRYLVDLPEAEVASVLGMSAGTVRSTLSRATDRLRALLGSPTDEDLTHALHP
jgi:RNA polymerase sigma-70 factor (sigma-E family)